MKTAIMKKLFVVSMSIMVAVTPITANAAAKNDVRMRGMMPAPSKTCSVTANAETNGKKVFGKYNTLINGTSGIKDSNNKIRYHVRILPSYGLITKDCTVIVYGYCTKIKSNGADGNRIAARFDTSYTFKNGSQTTTVDNDGTVTSSKDTDAYEFAYISDPTKSVKTKTKCSKKKYEAKSIPLSSTNPYWK